jgi:outer membrane lipoprotein-sorting protein
MSRRTGLSLLAAVLGLSLTGAVAEDVDAVEKKIIAAWGKQQSLTAKVNVVTRMELGTIVAESKSEGTYAFLRQGDKILARTELKSTMIQKAGDKETKTEQKVTHVIDGEFAYTLSELDGQKMAVKAKIEPQTVGDPKAVFENLRKKSELKLLPEETVEGRKVYVIEATPKEKTPGGSPRETYAFDQESGFLVRQIGFGPDDKPMTTQTFSDLKLDVKLEPDSVKKFAVPEGVELIDQTKTKPPAE